MLNANQSEQEKNNSKGENQNKEEKDKDKDKDKNKDDSEFSRKKICFGVTKSGCKEMDLMISCDSWTNSRGDSTRRIMRGIWQ